MVKQIAANTNEIHQKDFLKVALFNYTTKGAMTFSFRKA